MQKIVEFDRSEIVTGKPLPFSIYDADRKVLLAARGQIVSDAMRQRLRAHNLYAVAEEGHGLAAKGSTDAEPPPVCPLAAFRQQQAKLANVTRVGFRISRDDRSETHTSWVVGIGARRGLLLTVPSIGDHNYLNINEGQTWRFRTFHALSAIRFSAVVERVIFDPFPYFHVELPTALEMRNVRKRPRASVCLDATIDRGTPTEALVVDLSAEGMCVALRKEQGLGMGDQMEVRLRLPILDESHEIQVEGTVVRVDGCSDPAHPDLAFFGLSVEPRSSLDRVMLHACVQERLAKDFDTFSRVLLT